MKIIDKTMENEYPEIIDSTIDTETTENEYSESVETEVAPQNDELETLRKANKTLEAQKEHWREKAEKNKTNANSTVNNQSVNGVSTKDLYALMEAKVPEEDISEVEDYAKYKGISIAEALKTQAVRSILNEKSEMRNVASATNTGGSKRVGGRVSDETLLANAEKGNFPDSDAEIDRLVKLQFRKK